MQTGHAGDVSPSPRTAIGHQSLWAALLMLLALKLVLMLFAPALGDEAYYWRWGQSLDWSYHDHPPLNALFLRASYELFGWNLFALRAPGIVSCALSISIVAWWAQRLMPAPTNAALAAAVVFLSSPLMFVFTTVMFPDHLLIALSLTAGHFFVLYAASVENGARAIHHLFAAALFVGLAALSKYSAVFVGFGFAGWFLLTPSGRRELRSVYPWLAGVVALATQAPVIWWNIQHNMSSFEFHFGVRIIGIHDPLDAIGRITAFLLPAALMFSPFLLPALWRFLRNTAGGDLGRYGTVGRTAFVSGMAVFSAFTILVISLFYWVIPAVALFYPAAVAHIGNGLRRVVGYGLFGAFVISAHFTIFPITGLFGSANDDRYGWSQVASKIDREATARGADLLLTSNYSLAALMGFQMQRTDVYSINDKVDQYDYWFDPAAHVGSDSIIVADSDRPLESTPKMLFETIEQIGTVTAYRFGRPVHDYILYFGHNLRLQRP